jgi:Flp pilus assembly protein TadD
MGLSLGLVMIVRNEAANLGRSLRPVASYFDDVVVVDTGSTDQTVSLAAGLGARVVEVAWQDDFAAARNASLAEARADYLFWLDGDNAITSADVASLRGVLAEADQPFIGWCVEVLEPRGERLLQKRLFPRRPEVFFQGSIHEQLHHPSGWPFVFIPVKVRHWGYENKALAQAKGQRNLALLLQAAKQRPADFFIHYQTGKTLFNLNKLDDAEKWIEIAIELDRKSAENYELVVHSWVLWALVAERRGRSEAAERRLEQGLAVLAGQPSRGLLHYHLGRLALDQGRLGRAVEHLSQAERLGLTFLTLDLDLDRLGRSLAVHLGRALLALGRVDQAVARLRLLTQAQPDHPVPWRELVRTLLAAGRMSEARAALAQLLARFPGDRAGLAWQAELGN